MSGVSYNQLNENEKIVSSEKKLVEPAHGTRKFYTNIESYIQNRLYQVWMSSKFMTMQAISKAPKELQNELLDIHQLDNVTRVYPVTIAVMTDAVFSNYSCKFEKSDDMIKVAYKVDEYLETLQQIKNSLSTQIKTDIAKSELLALKISKYQNFYNHLMLSMKHIMKKDPTFRQVHSKLFKESGFEKYERI